MCVCVSLWAKYLHWHASIHTALVIFCDITFFFFFFFYELDTIYYGALLLQTANPWLITVN